MPIYEYKCENGHVFDVMQRMSDDPLMECIKCGALVRKVLQPVGISFKGSGFYSTDYSDSKKDPKAEPKEAAAKSSGSSNGASSDSGAAAKKPEKTSTGPANKGD
jgi:putative FmdB family regulatory protein